MDTYTDNNAAPSNHPSADAEAAPTDRANGSNLSVVYPYAYASTSNDDAFYNYGPTSGQPFDQQAGAHYPGFFQTNTAISSYTYAGSSGITKGDAFAKPHRIGRAIRRYSDSDQSVARTIIKDVDIFPLTGTEFTSMHEINRMVAEELASMDMDEALYIRELSRSITMGPIIPGTQTREIRLALAPDFAHKDI